MANLRAEGKINERDFLDRAELLCSLGHIVMITNFQEYYRLVEYFAPVVNPEQVLKLVKPNFEPNPEIISKKPSKNL